MLFFGLLASQIQAGVLCRPFRIHLAAELPNPNKDSLDYGTVEELLSAIASIPEHDDYPQYFERSLRTGELALNDQDKTAFLSCVFQYIRQDTDNDGVPDWSGLSNHRPTSILIPLDPDMDGDGIENIFDPRPLVNEPNKQPPESAIPKHIEIENQQSDPLSSTSPQATANTYTKAQLQELLWQEYSTIAVDYTDKHSKIVLYELLMMLRHGLPEGYFSNDQGYRILYAFKGHDTRWNIAAYHRDIRAMSIGGASVYTNSKLDPQSRVRLVAALAHEFGHDFTFSSFSAKELQEISRKFGGWQIPAEEQGALTLDAPAFLTPYNKPDFDNDPNQEEEYFFQNHSFTTQYALTNVHEWFCDAFAAWVLQRLGHSGMLGDNWRSLLVFAPNNQQEYWTNYNNLANRFAQWLDQKTIKASAPIK
jgi:hypothetical protein